MIKIAHQWSKGILLLIHSKMTIAEPVNVVEQDVEVVFAYVPLVLVVVGVVELVVLIVVVVMAVVGPVVVVVVGVVVMAVVALDVVVVVPLVGVESAAEVVRFVVGAKT